PLSYGIIRQAMRVTHLIVSGQFRLSTPALPRQIHHQRPRWYANARPREFVLVCSVNFWVEEAVPAALALGVLFPAAREHGGHAPPRNVGDGRSGVVDAHLADRA